MEGYSVEITSTTNKLVIYASKLKEKKFRDQEGKFLIEGEHLISMANNIETIFTTNRNYHNEKVMVVYTNEVVLKKISQVEAPQNIIAICKKITTTIDYNKDKYLICDGVQDPGNLGSIIRTCLAFNIDYVLLSKGSVDIYNDKVIRGSQGAIFKINIAYCDLDDTLDKLKANNITIYTSTLQSDSVNLKDIKKIGRFCLIVGNEGSGVSTTSLNKSDVKVKIAHSNSIDSLNVGVATSIMLYHFDSLKED